MSDMSVSAQQSQPRFLVHTGPEAMFIPAETILSGEFLRETPLQKRIVSARRGVCSVEHRKSQTLQILNGLIVFKRILY